MELTAKKISLILVTLVVIGILGLGVLGIIVLGNVFQQTSVPEGNIAVIEVNGPIMTGGGSSPWGSVQAQSDRIMDQINRARESEEVKALLLKVNSPGGSAAASEAIYQELEKFSATDRPIVVSMGEVAASGGYYVSALADEIYANSATTTGSIGAIMNSQNLEGLYDKLGIEQETIKSGEYKDLGSPNRPLEEDERQLLENMINQIHEQFVEAVTQGRGMDKSQVEELADGRIYNGQQAQEVGLVDSIGTFYDAKETAAELAGIEGEPETIQYGQPNLLEQIIGSAYQLGFSGYNEFSELDQDLTQRELLNLMYEQRYKNLKIEY